MTFEHAKDCQAVWKSRQQMRIRCAIVQQALIAGSIWPDELDITKIAEVDRNCIGPSYGQLVRAGVLECSYTECRKSKAGSARGRLVFHYRIKSRAVAESFLRRNGEVPVVGQMELGTFNLQPSTPNSQ